MSPELAALVADLASRHADVDSWFDTEFARHRPPFYCSVDLRASIDKIVQVDANLFPGGFNNLDEAALKRAANTARPLIARHCPHEGTLAVVVEAHTRNRFYADHLAALEQMLIAAGANVRLAQLGGEKRVYEGNNGQVKVHVLRRSGDKVSAGGMTPEAVLLNNDMSGGVPKDLIGVRQPVLPPLSTSWAIRRKSNHFFHYERVAARFANAFDCDPWRLTPYFNVCHQVDISRSVGLGCLTTAVGETLDDIRTNHIRLGVREKPFVVLKADTGTYGMGVVMVDNEDRVHKLNRRERNSLTVVKDGMPVRDILIQEGVATTDKVGTETAEPVCYIIDGKYAGGFWRVNCGKSPTENLNSRGMRFVPMTTECGGAQTSARDFAIEIIARLGTLATAREISEDVAGSATLTPGKAT